jgi:hypothetical protein
MRAMRRVSRSVAYAVVGLCLSAIPALATFHIMVIEEVFFGLPEAPAAQFVVLEMQAPVQTAVYGQPFGRFDASGAALEPFAAFCATPRAACSFPTVSPACSAGDCPTAFDANGRSVLAATRWAQGLFCVTADVSATQSLLYPDGRVCFGDCGLRSDCGDGQVDCLAYGGFSGDNGIFGIPATAPSLGMALVGSPNRTNQFLGGNLLDNATGFSVGAPTPRNFHDDVGSIDGMAGDANGDLTLGPEDVGGEVDNLFASATRCGLPANQRGADANFDTRVSAADLIKVLGLVTSSVS